MHTHNKGSLNAIDKEPNYPIDIGNIPYLIDDINTIQQ
jgi:hypothetical protein